MSTSDKPAVYGVNVPKKYHKLLYIGELDRRGNVIDFKVPPVIVHSPQSISAYKRTIFTEYVAAEDLPVMYTNARPFMILRPTALDHKLYVKDQLLSAGLRIVEELHLDNFMQLADTIYDLNPVVSFHWQWRVIMRTVHDTKVQDQNTAIVFVLERQETSELHQQRIMLVKKAIRDEIGEIPFIIKYKNRPKIALGIHHLHAPDFHRVAIEYNALMHAKNKTSVFS